MSNYAIEQSGIEFIVLNKAPKQPTPQGMKGLVHRYGSAYERKQKGQKNGETAVSQMLRNFAKSGLVRSEPAFFGKPLSQLVKPAHRVNIYHATLKNFALHNVAREQIIPFGLPVGQITGTAH